jgi:hypothetical protein
VDTTIFNGAGINDAKKCLMTINDLGFAEIMDGVYANLKEMKLGERILR